MNNQYEIISDKNIIELYYSKKIYRGGGDGGDKEIYLYNDARKKDWLAFDFDKDFEELEEHFIPVDYQSRINLNKDEMISLIDSLKESKSIYFIYPQVKFYDSALVDYYRAGWEDWTFDDSLFNAYFKYDGSFTIQLEIEAENYRQNLKDSIKSKLSVINEDSEHYITIESTSLKFYFKRTGKRRYVIDYHCYSDLLNKQDFEILNEDKSIVGIQVNDFYKYLYQVDFIHNEQHKYK